MHQKNLYTIKSFGSNTGHCTSPCCPFSSCLRRRPQSSTRSPHLGNLTHALWTIEGLPCFTSFNQNKTAYKHKTDMWYVISLHHHVVMQWKSNRNAPYISLHQHTSQHHHINTSSHNTGKHFVLGLVGQSTTGEYLVKPLQYKVVWGNILSKHCSCRIVGKYFVQALYEYRYCNTEGFKATSRENTFKGKKK